MASVFDQEFIQGTLQGRTISNYIKLATLTVLIYDVGM